MLEDCERLALQFPRAHGIHVVTYIQPSVQNVHFSLNNGWNDKFNQNTGWSIFQLTNMFNIYETFPQRNRDKVQSCSCRTLKYITTDGQILAHACHKDFSNRDDRERESRSGRFAIGQVILPEACTTYTDGKKKKNYKANISYLWGNHGHCPHEKNKGIGHLFWCLKCVSTQLYQGLKWHCEKWVFDLVGTKGRVKGSIHFIQSAQIDGFCNFQKSTIRATVELLSQTLLF